MAIFIPEIVIYETIKSFIDVINEDWTNKDGVVTEDQTILYHIFGKDLNDNDIQIGDFNYFEQAKEIFLRSESDRRFIGINLGYNLERQGMPTIHLLLPHESSFNQGVGSNEGYADYYEDKDSDDNDVVFPTLTHGSNVMYNLFITSENMMEVVLTYHFLKYCMLSLSNHMENGGLQALKFGGSDIQFTPDLLPKHVFHRNFSLEFTYDYSAVDLTAPGVLKEITGVSPNRAFGCGGSNVPGVLYPKPGEEGGVVIGNSGDSGGTNLVLYSLNEALTGLKDHNGLDIYVRGYLLNNTTVPGQPPSYIRYLDTGLTQDVINYMKDEFIVFRQAIPIPGQALDVIVDQGDREVLFRTRSGEPKSLELKFQFDSPSYEFEGTWFIYYTKNL